MSCCAFWEHAALYYRLSACLTHIRPHLIQSCLIYYAVFFLQGEKDWQKYETARRLKKCVDRIRNQYREDWKSKEMRIRQRAVALYFIDKVRCIMTIDIVM